MKLLIKPFQWIYCIYALLVFIALMFLALPLVVIGSLFGKIKGGNFIYKVCKYWALSWYILVGLRHKNVYEYPHDKEGTYIFVANHSSYMDIPPIVLAFNQPLRVLGKYEMVKYPVFGYIYKRAAITVDRSNAEKRAKSVRQLKAVLRKHISIFIFPEGTFNESKKPLKEFFDGAFRIALETQTPIKPILFVDALDRLHYSSIFNLTPGICRVVFLETIDVKGMHMKDLPQLKALVHEKMEAGLRKYRNYKDEE